MWPIAPHMPDHAVLSASSCLVWASNNPGHAQEAVLGFLPPHFGDLATTSDARRALVFAFSAPVLTEKTWSHRHNSTHDEVISIGRADHITPYGPRRGARVSPVFSVCMRRSFFYATLDDQEALLGWLFAQSSSEVYETCSAFERPLEQYKSSAEVISRVRRNDHDDGNSTGLLLQVHVVGGGPAFTPRRLVLDPRCCGGATYRYAADGLGTVELFLGAGSSTGLRPSHVANHTRKDADTWARLVTDQPRPENWNFGRIGLFAACLRREIARRAKGHHNMVPMLREAKTLWEASVPLAPIAGSRQLSREDVEQGALTS